MSTRTQDRVGGSIDTLTVAGIAGTAYILGTAVHEFAGHALTCAALGGRVRELNAFYVDCDYLGMADGTIRAVALAGPVASLLLGLFAFVLVQKRRSKSVPLQIFLWLLGSIGMMTATGYLLFSGALGLGDFGTDRDGVLFELSPEWAWRIAITLLGLAGYAYSMRKSIVVMEGLIGGGGIERVYRALRIALTSYLTGGLVSIIAGLFNPLGVIIVLISAAAASLGGTSGIAWEMTIMKRDRETGREPLVVKRDWKWVGVGLVMVLVYAVVFGPSIRL